MHQVDETIIYEQNGQKFEGFVAYPKGKKEKLPAVIVVHEWDGLGGYAKMRAKMLAENGYFAFALDMYGQGKRAKDYKEAAALSGEYYKDRALLRSRIQTALEVLKKRKEVDASRIAIIGYCFGGMVAIEAGLMASGVKAIAAFHASLKFPSLTNDAKNIKVPVLIHHGGADSAVPEKDVNALKAAFGKAGVKYQFIVHPGATHAFTNKKNTGGPETMGMKYDAKADLASWASLLSFLHNNLK
ncbi:MAG: hypothetical protein LDLANPLL_02337 [Turneriella sp.]|nr:hypothetical protein [Turneriella sp.]